MSIAHTKSFFKLHHLLSGVHFQLQQNQEVMEMLQKHIGKLPPISTTTTANITDSNHSINSIPQSKPSVAKSSPQVKFLTCEK